MALLSNASDARAALSALSSSVVDCPLRIGAGLYRPANVVVFLILDDRYDGGGGGGGGGGELEEIVFADDRVRNHEKAVTARFKDDEDVLVLSRYSPELGSHQAFKVWEQQKENKQTFLFSS